MRKLLLPFLASIAFALPMLAASPASAGLESCGNINVSAQAKCELKTEGGCTASCDSLSLNMACSVEAYGSCEGQCNVTPPSCDVNCQGSCEGQCKVDPVKFDCQANCQATCDGNCSGECSSSANKSECEASCKATCKGECEGSCTASGGSADCSGKCQGSCQGSCNASANMDCQLQCQGSAVASCKGDLKIDCEAQCKQPKGALFCDGQYVDAGGNLEDCIASLEAALNIKVSGSASADCGPNGCEAEAEGSASCGGHVAPVAHNEWPMALGLVSALGIFTAARRRRNRK